MKTQLVITDEVNCKFLNLDVGTRNYLVKKFKYVDPRARHMAAVKLGRWDGATKYFQLGGSTYINLLPEILPILIERGYEIEIIDKRDYERSFSFEPITESQYSHLQWNDDFEQVGKPIMIRDYQVPLINTFLDNTQSIQEIATGAGKSIMTAALSDAVSKLGRSIVIVPNTDLVHNTVKYYKALGLECGVYHGDKKEWGMRHTICTWQSLNVLLKNSIDDENEPDKSITDFLDGVVCVIVDECFSGDSLVLTPNGYIPIKDVSSGDTVINYSEDTKEFKEDMVVKKHINLTNSHSEKMYELEFGNGVKIKVTGNHKFLTNLGWCRADELTHIHDVIFKEYRNCMKLIKRTEIQKPNEVYNLHIKNDHNYVVSGAVVSNCHQASADVLKKLMTGVMAHIPIRWGFTGTVPKLPFHYVPLKIGIGEVVGKLSASELQESGVLSNCHVNVIQMVDYPVYPSYQTEMKYLLTTPERIEFIAGMIRDISESGNTLVLVDRIPTGKMLTSLIPGAVFVHGNVKSKDRQAEYDEVAIIDNKTIVATYGVAAVGINIPRIFNMVMLEPGKSFTRVIQSIGRGIRKAEDKDFVQIWDFTSTCKFVKRQLTVRKKFYAEANYPYTIKKITWM